MSSYRKGLMDCLSRQDMKLINVKFCRGDSPVITVDEFAQELCSSHERRATGEVKAAHGAPRCKKAPVDVREYVAAL